jgi:hypothetical protein
MTIKKLLRPTNTDGIGNWLRRARIEGGVQVALQSGIMIDPRLLSPAQTNSLWERRSMRENINTLIKSCCTQTEPAAETKSMGLPADASAT